MVARPDEDLRVIAVDDDDVPSLDPACGIRDPSNDRDVEGPRDDRDMRGWRSLFEYQAPDRPAGVIHQLGRTHGAGDDNELGRQFRPRCARRISRQMVLETVRQIFEIMKALAK